MRIAAYVRERPAVDDAEPAFAQGERIRRWASDHGHQLVAMCHDDSTIGSGAPGFRALLGVVDSGAADGAAVASLAAFGDDLADQEIRLWELRSRGVEVHSTAVSDTSLIDGTGEDEMRRTARTLLDRLDVHRRSLADG